MAAKLLTLEEAADRLDISPDKLTALRESNKISAVRVGSNWKFKEQELIRYAEELASGSGTGLSSDDDSGTIDLSPPISAADAGKSDVVLLSEFELGESNPGTSSTIIGKVRGVTPPDSDLQVGGSSIGKKKDSDVELVINEESKPGDSDLKLVPSGSTGSLPTPASQSGGDDDLDLVDLSIDETRSSSSLPLDAGGSSVTGSSIMLGGPEASGRGSSLMGPSSPAGMKGGSSVAGRGSSGGIALGSDVIDLGDDLKLGSGVSKTGATPSTGKLGKGTGSGVELGSGAFEDDDLVLGSLSGSDVTLNPSESGISLADPADSGLSLEEPLELGSESGSELAPEDTFELTPMADAGDDDSSGSQVIALDSEAEFDDAAATMLGPDAGAHGMMEEMPTFDALGGGLEPTTDFGAPGMMPGMGMPGMPGMMPGMAPGMAPGMMPGVGPGPMMGAGPPAISAPYSLLNVISLFGCLLILTLTGIMMFDLVVHIWSWDSGYSRIGSGLMDGIVGLFENTK